MTDHLPEEKKVTVDVNYLLGKLREDNTYSRSNIFFNQIFDPRYSHHFPVFNSQVIVTMLLDPRIRYGLALIKGPIITYTKFFNSKEAEEPGIHQAIVELNYHFPYKVEAENEETEKYIINQLSRFWEVGLAKALTAVDYGYSGSEVQYRKDKKGKLHFNNIFLYPTLRLQAVVKRGGVVGFIRGEDRSTFVPIGKGFWHVHQRERNPYYGESGLKGAHIPWHETWMLGGARDIRRTWFFKNAYDGGELYYPDGNIQTPTGENISHEAYALEMLEMKRSGSAMAFPSTKGLDGKRQWEYVPPKASVTPGGMEEYIKLLRDEELEGMGIPPEVVQSAGNDGMGSATGRMVPFMAFIASLTPIAQFAIEDFSEQILKPMLRINKMDDEFSVRKVVPKTEDPNAMATPVQEKTVQDTGAATGAGAN